MTYEQFVDAANTYIDLLAAYSALAISQDLEKRIKDLYDAAVKNYDANKTKDLEIEKSRIGAELKFQQSTQYRLQGQIDSASAKLAYLLGIDPSVAIVPMDSQMAAFHVVDVNQPADQLIGEALANGPGVREIEGILGAIQSGLGDAQGPGRFLPIFQFQMGEGIFGAGPGGTMDWANRFDLGVAAKWNISDLCTAKHKRQVAMAQISQVQMTYAELRARLTLGVQEARTTSLAAFAQFAAAEEMIGQARTVAKNTRLLYDAGNMNGVLGSAVVQALKGVSLAQMNFVDLMRDYDKAQLRLLAITGACKPSITATLPNANLHQTEKRPLNGPAK